MTDRGLVKIVRREVLSPVIYGRNKRLPTNADSRSRLFNILFGRPRTGKNIVGSLGATQSGSPPAIHSPNGSRPAKCRPAVPVAFRSAIAEIEGLVR
jgi:hypothetical protein